MFTCILELHYPDEEVSFTRTIQLPFVPFMGLKIDSVLKENDEAEYITVNEVIWDYKNECFTLGFEENLDRIDMDEGICLEWEPVL